MVNEDLLFKVAKLIVLGLVIHLFVLGYVFYTDYQGRKTIATSAREGCERDKQSRRFNAQGWRIAEAARREEGQIVISSRYAALASNLERLGGINCQARYPKASLIP